MFNAESLTAGINTLSFPVPDEAIAVQLDDTVLEPFGDVELLFDTVDFSDLFDRFQAEASAEGRFAR